MNEKQWSIVVSLIQLTAIIPASLYVIWLAPLPWKWIYLGCLWAAMAITQIRYYFQLRELRRVEESFKQLLKHEEN